MKVLIVGPSSTKSKGGMATVIKEIEKDEELSRRFRIDSYASYIDGNRIKVLLYSAFAFLRFFFTKRNYDIYHIHAASRGSTFRKGYYVRAAKRWGKKVIFHIHGAQYLLFYEEINSRKKREVVSILKSADQVIALSKDWKRKFDTAFGLTNCIVIENGINLKELASAIQPVEKYQKSFLMLGRLGKRKGAYDLVNAIELVAEAIPDVKCYLAGDGDIEQIKRMVEEKQLNKNIEIVGWVDSDRKTELLSKISTVVLPSYNEGLPMSILEGMACGKAIISTNVGAIPEVVKKENGILVEAGDINALANAIKKLCMDCDCMKAMSRENLCKIRQKYGMEVIHDKIADCYEKLYEENA